MVPRVAQTGHSFKGAGMYYLHDKQAKTNDRVAWTHTHNIPTNNPDKAFKWMAYTAMNSNRLKQKAGIAPTGRKQTAGTVYSFSLAWAPHQNPDKATMMEAAFETLGLLKLNEHEAVFVAHNDTAHPHVHVICNLIHPENGKKAVLSYDFLTMSQWAEGVERSDGEILCPQRIINNEMRRNGKSLTHEFALVKHRDKKLLQNDQIQKLYDNAENGIQFQEGLKDLGYILARGDRRGLVLVDKNDKVVDLARQIKGQRAADIKKRLYDLEAVPHVKEVLNPRPFDRDKYETERQKKIVDAAIEESRKQPEKKTKDGKAKEHVQKYDESHLQELDAIRDWEQKSQRMRDKLTQQQEAYYNRKEIIHRIKTIEQALQNRKSAWDITGSIKSQKLEMLNLRKSLKTIDQRIAEQKNALEIKILELKPSNKTDYQKLKEDKINELKVRRGNENKSDLDLDR